MNKHQFDLNRVEFYTIDNLANGHYLSKAEPILRSDVKLHYDNINDVLELYNIKQYIDNDLFLKVWTSQDIDHFKKKATEYGNIIGMFMSKINDENIIPYYESLLQGYINSFWELVNNQKIFKNISTDNFKAILSIDPHEINTILHFKKLVSHYKTPLSQFLIDYSKSAEIILSIYEEKQDFHRKEMFLPDNLTVKDKEDIISKYLDSEEANSNYFHIIQNAKDKSNFKISDKTRLKAKRKEKEETEKIFENHSGFQYGVSISFPEKLEKIKQGSIEDFVANYSYSLDFIKQYRDDYSLFRNFKLLFEYLDSQNRISLVNRRIDNNGFLSYIGVHSQNEYRHGVAFTLSEMTSQAQIFAYNKILSDLGNSLDIILQHIFTSTFHDNFNFASNAQLLMPTATISYLEKVILLAPQFERVLKQYKLFVEEGSIDFELLEISSSPCTITDIPSLNLNKYIYFNEDNQVMVKCANLFFSDQTLLAYVDPYKNNHYHTFFDLLANEQVDYINYEEHQKPQIEYLINNGFIFLDKNNLIQITNHERVLILKDLYENEVGSFYHYPIVYQEEAKQMEVQNIIFFESSLFSKPEQSYFNYFLNKSEFTNGLDLRNSYLHGTQANPEKTQKHENAYFTYLKLLVLVLLKIEDDLLISKTINGC